MNGKVKDIPWVNGDLFNKNANEFPAEELLKYAGHHVAWNFEGTQILAYAPSCEALEKRLEELSVDPSQVVWDYIPGVHEDTCVGGSLSE